MSNQSSKNISLYTEDPEGPGWIPFIKGVPAIFAYMRRQRELQLRFREAASYSGVPEPDGLRANRHEPPFGKGDAP